MEDSCIMIANHPESDLKVSKLRRVADYNEWAFKMSMTERRPLLNEWYSGKNKVSADHKHTRSNRL